MIIEIIIKAFINISKLPQLLLKHILLSCNQTSFIIKLRLNTNFINFK